MADDAFYSLNLKPIRRSDDADSVARVAYILGARIRNDALGSFSNFTPKSSHVFHRGRVHPEVVPDWALNVADMWNENERANRRKDAQLGQRLLIGIPNEIPLHQRAPTVSQLAQYLTDTYGVLVEFALHIHEEDHNPHAHVIFTDRPVNADGFGKKVRHFAKKSFYFEIRDKWEEIANAALAASGSTARVSAKSYASRGIGKTPQRHRGIEGAGRAQAELQPELISSSDIERVPVMSRKPTARERIEYPEIKTLDFPPRLEDAETDRQRAAVKRYYEDNPRAPSDLSDAERAEYDAYLSELHAGDREAQKQEEPTRDIHDGWDLSIERSNRSVDVNLERIQRREAAELEYEDLRRRARDMYLIYPKHEREALKRVRNEPKEVQDATKDRIIEDRMRLLQQRDFEERQRALDEQIKRSAREHEQRDREEFFREAEQNERAPERDR